VYLQERKTGHATHERVACPAEYRADKKGD
jgi:hypothetical protein